MPDLLTRTPLTDRYALPGEFRIVDPEAAARLRSAVVRAALELGMDKVTSAVVLLDAAIELIAGNRPSYGPEVVRELTERGVVVHFGGR